MADKNKKSKIENAVAGLRLLVARIAPAVFIVGLALFVKYSGDPPDGSSASAGAAPSEYASENERVTQGKIYYERLTPTAAPSGGSTRPPQGRTLEERIDEALRRARSEPASPPARYDAPPAYRPQPAWSTQTASTAAADPPDGYYYVSLKSAPDAAGIQHAIPELREKYRPVLGGLPVKLRIVDLGSRGVTYRAVAGPLATKFEAQDLCQKVKEIGGDRACFFFR